MALRETSIYISRDHKEALRVAAIASGRTCPEEQLEAVLSEWLTRNPAFATYVKERARLRDEADGKALELAGLKPTT